MAAKRRPPLLADVPVDAANGPASEAEAIRRFVADWVEARQEKLAAKRQRAEKRDPD